MFSLVLIFGCNNQSKVYIKVNEKTIVEEGKGFNSINLEKVNRDSIVKYFGNDFKDVNHNNYSNEMCYEKNGISFYSKNKSNNSTIFNISFSENFKGKTSKGFSISSMLFSDVLNLYGNPSWRFSKESDEIIAYYSELGIEFCLQRNLEIPDTIPTSYFTQDIYVNRLLLNYFKQAYGKQKLKEFTICIPDQDSDERPNLEISQIDTVFKIGSINKQADLLNGRILLNVPEKSLIDDSYIEIENFEQKLSISIVDFQCKASSNIKEDILSIIKTWNKNEYDIIEVKSKLNIAIYKVEPKKLKLEEGEDEFFLKGVFIKNADSTILFIKFFINTNAWNNKENYKELANEIIKTIKPGHRQLNLMKETITLNINGKSIKITKPNGIVYTKKRGPDFEVINFNKFVQLNELQSSMLIYFGNHPNFLFNQNDEKVSIVKKYGILFGQKIEWNYCYKNSKKEFPYTIEGINYSINIHVAITVSSEEDYILFRNFLPNTDL